MANVSPLNAPVNLNICSTSGTIFSTPPSGSGGGSSNFSITNIGGQIGIWAQTIGAIAQLKSLLQGANVILTPTGATIGIAVPDLAFNANRPIKRNIAGLLGVNLNATTLLTALQNLLYPVIFPSASLTPAPIEFEFGDATPIIVNYIATQGDNPILTISVNSVPITPITGSNQSGSVNVNKTGSLSIVIPMQVADNAGNVANASVTVPVGRKIRVGPTAKDGIVVPILDSDVNGLTGYFSTVPQLPETSVTLNSQYLAISIPDSLLNGYIPTFKLNGFVTNAFTLVRNNAFVNTFGYSEPTSIWESNTILTGTFEFEID